MLGEPLLHHGQTDLHVALIQRDILVVIAGDKAADKIALGMIGLALQTNHFLRLIDIVEAVPHLAEFHQPGTFFFHSFGHCPGHGDAFQPGELRPESFKGFPQVVHPQGKHTHRPLMRRQTENANSTFYLHIAVIGAFPGHEKICETIIGNLVSLGKFPITRPQIQRDFFDC